MQLSLQTETCYIVFWSVTCCEYESCEMMTFCNAAWYWRPHGKTTVQNSSWKVLPYVSIPHWLWIGWNSALMIGFEAILCCELWQQRGIDLAFHVDIAILCGELWQRRGIDLAFHVDIRLTLNTFTRIFLFDLWESLFCFVFNFHTSTHLYLEKLVTHVPFFQNQYVCEWFSCANNFCKWCRPCTRVTTTEELQ